MLAPAVLLALLVAAPLAPPHRPDAPDAVRAVPAEPGAVVLPEAAILQTVAADIAGDGSRELVRLVRGEGDAALVEVWAERESGWARLGEPIVAVPASRGGPRTDPVYLATPVRMLVRAVGGEERVTVATQPHFEEIDTGEPCCLLLNDLVVGTDGDAGLTSVAEPADVASAILPVDLDGDGTDELLATLSLPPAGDISYPVEARVHRWAGAGFARPTVTNLPVGSGDAPFVLDDSDGLPGDEAAIISTLGPPGLFRIRLADGDTLVIDRAGLEAEQALGIPLGDGRGVAVRGPVIDIITAPWPPGGRVGEPMGTSPLGSAQLLGTIDVDGVPSLAIHRPEGTTLDVLRLPGLERHDIGSIPRSPAAARLADGPPVPFIGSLPGSSDPSAPTILHAGRLATGETLSAGVVPPAATLAGALPIGLVGDGSLLAIHHGPIGVSPPGPFGGPLVVPGAQPLAWTTIAPFEQALTPELDAGILHVEARGALVIGDGELAAGPDGFTVDVAAPPGSRILLGDGATLARTSLEITEAGHLDVMVEPSSPQEGDDGPARQRVIVLTPAGHAYVAAWDVVTRTGPPDVEVRAMTPFGSSAVEVSGQTVRGARVRVDGRPVPIDEVGRFATGVELPPWPTDVTVEVDDGLGNVARTTTSGIGLFDYRGLPWVPIVGVLLATAAVVLFLRVPRPAPVVRRTDDDAALEELEPD